MIPLLLAQVETMFSPTHLFAFLGIVAFLAGLAVAIKILIKREPPMHREFMARTECQSLHAKVQDDLDHRAAAQKKLYEAFDAQGREIATLKVSIAQVLPAAADVKSQGQDIAGLKKETEMQTRQLASLDLKMDQVLLRLPRPPAASS